MVTLHFVHPAHNKKRILIVNCYLDDSRRCIPRPNKVPPAMGPVYLAGAFCRETCEVRLYNEQSSGPLVDPRLLTWADMVVLTGLTTALDRMKQLTALARTKNPKVIVVAGGPPIRALPRYSGRFFDYSCLGDIEELQQVATAALGRKYVSDEMAPRFDLADWLGRIGYVESSRYCNFHCAFCSLTGEGRRYQKYGLDAIRRQIVALGKRKYLFFIDNNFYGNDRLFFLQRLEMLRELRHQGYFKHWGALVTNDFFLNDDALRLAHETGCTALFCGVESFDARWLRSVNKNQNTRAPQVEMISKCLQAGIVFLYGLIVDASARPVQDLHRELQFITGTPEITLPSFLTLAIPLLGTPHFYDCLAQGRMLPKTKVRDLNSLTFSLRPADDLETAVQFVRDMDTLRGYRGRILKHSAGFYRKYRSALTADQMAIALYNSAYFSAQNILTAPAAFCWSAGRGPRRTHVSTTEILDPVYTPPFPIDSRYQSHFEPTMLTDSAGEVTRELADDLASIRVVDARV
ncbi:MAG TPA: radical SAM protein [Candidatus Binatia bacterium]